LAVLHHPSVSAPGAQRLQLLLQPTQFAYTPRDLVDVRIYNGVDFVTALRGRIAKRKQRPDLRQ
jgi:hypothetical protein